MKTLFIFITIFITSVLFSQVKTEKCQSFYEDKELGKLLFNTVNEYRTTLKQSPYVWSDHWYGTSLKWNNHLAQNGLWGHRNGPEWTGIGGSELIVAITLPNKTEVNKENYKLIVDSCLNQWIHSPMHHAMIKAPIKTNTKESEKLDLTGDGILDIDVMLVKFGGISANVNRYKTYTIVQFIFHLGYYVDYNYSYYDLSNYH
jgi:hypothetical protein